MDNDYYQMKYTEKAELVTIPWLQAFSLESFYVTTNSCKKTIKEFPKVSCFRQLKKSDQIFHSI